MVFVVGKVVSRRQLGALVSGMRKGRTHCQEIKHMYDESSKNIWLLFKHRDLYFNELVIHEIWNNPSAIFQNFLFSCCKIEFVQCGRNP